MLTLPVTALQVVATKEAMAVAMAAAAATVEAVVAALVEDEAAVARLPATYDTPTSAFMGHTHFFSHAAASDTCLETAPKAELRSATTAASRVISLAIVLLSSLKNACAIDASSPVTSSPHAPTHRRLFPQHVTTDYEHHTTIK